MRSSLALAMVGLSIASGAIAQKQTEADTGTNIPIPRRARLPETPGLSAADRRRIAMAEFARCTVDRQSGRVARLLALPAEDVNTTALAAMADDECLASGMMRFKPMLLRGALFVEVYRRRSEAGMRKVAWQLPVVPFDPNTQTTTVDGDRNIQMGLLVLAQCVAEHDPVDAKAVVMARTASPAQNAAFAALAPNISQCLPSGQKLTLGKIILEGALGEVLYRGVVPSARPASQESK